MHDLSVVLATFNEEKNLAECLDSVVGFASEIVVVDGSSKDKTVEIAKKYGAKVVVTDNPPVFHINKQKAIDLATKKWILQLDADERVTNELQKEIEISIKEADMNKINGFWIPRKNYFLGRFLTKGGQYPDYTLRLYRKGKGKLPQKDVHEQAIVEGKTTYLTSALLHMADRTFSHYLFRFNRYTDFIASQLRNKEIKGPFVGIRYMVVLPIWWFLLTYIRHKGFVDGWQGFVFSFFSALRFPVSYVKYLKK